MNEILILIIRNIALICLILIFFLPFFIQSKIYYPSKQLFLVEIPYEDIFIKTEDGLNINAWYSPPAAGNFTILFCHGNGGNLSFYGEIIETLQENGYGVLAIDYRGYGKSEGKPSEQGLYTDLRSAVLYLKEQKNTPEEEIVLWGLSLGGAVVAQAASENGKFKGVVLQSSFTSIKDMSSDVLHRLYLGVSSDYRNYYSHNLIKALPVFEKFDTKGKIAGIKAPLLIAHSVPDNIVPVQMSIELAKINKKARVFISEDGGHNDHKWFYPKLFEFLKSLKGASKNSIF
ncbi:MAG TPA: alpha/beta hydrolase [Candidatus Gastranaerophilales bacterium]|nr:alpha/beta hydrolase [Candidatus Gastranaerophilales bacterium]